MDHKIFIVYFIHFKRNISSPHIMSCFYVFLIGAMVFLTPLKTAYSKTTLDSNNVALFDWTNETIGNIGNGKNYNKIPGYNWGVGNRSDDKSHQVFPYSKTNPGSLGPGGEKYGVELEFGDDSILPRSKGTKSLRHYVDCSQPSFQKNKLDRSEVHIRTTFEDMGIKEGSTFWLGWSEYYTQIDNDRVTTILQFRNQPPGISGGPVISLELNPTGSGTSYHVNVREGGPSKWKIPRQNKHTMKDSISLNTWYDFIVQIKYSRERDGYFRIWHKNAGKAMSLDNPDWVYTGPTMYQYPTGSTQPTPALRWGLYRYNCKSQNIVKSCNALTNENRYMTKFLGPVRFWKGSNDKGFTLVHPKQ